MKAGVVIFPGSNCDQDLILALNKQFEGNVVELWHKDTDLKGATHVYIPGGFSYGDYLRSGAIAKSTRDINMCCPFQICILMPQFN